jgi:membrane fusion protein, copper/silver efflux system
MTEPHNPIKFHPFWIRTLTCLSALIFVGCDPGSNRNEHANPAAIGAHDHAAQTEGGQSNNSSDHRQVQPSDHDDTPEERDDVMASTRLELTTRAAALMQVQVWPVQARQVSKPIRMYGRIGFDETSLSTIAAWMPGRLDRLYIDFTGTAVRRGQPMVEIYSPDLITAQEEHLQVIQTARELQESGVEAVRETTRLTVEASHDRLRLLGLSAEQIQRLEQQGQVDERLIIPAPSSGIVIERLAATGDYVETGQPIYRLADMTRLWVELQVYESDLQWLETGQPAVFETQSYPGERFQGAVAFIDPFLDEQTRTVRVRVDVANPDGRLKPGMFVRGVLEAAIGSHPEAVSPDDEHAGHAGHTVNAGPHPAEPGQGLPLVIPATAPLITGQRALVYVQLPRTEQPTFEPREVVLGPRAGAWYIVREGLSEGELVVVNGGVKIDSELQIRGRPSMMQPEGGAPPVHDHGPDAPPAVPDDPHRGH